MESEIQMKKFLALALLCASLAANAAPVYFTSSSAFDTAAGSTSALDASAPAQPGPTLSFSWGTVVSSNWFNLNANELAYGGNGVQGYQGFTFTFDSMVSAFGATVTDLGTVGQTDFTVSVYRGATLLGTDLLFDNFVGGTGNNLFAGIVDTDGFDRLVFTNTASPDDYVEMKSLRTAAAVSELPEPGSIALLGLGLAGLAVVRKRKQA